MKHFNFLLALFLLLFLVGGITIYFNSKEKGSEVVYIKPADNGIRKIDSITKEHLKQEQKAKQDSANLSKQIDSLKLKYNEAKTSLTEERKKNMQLVKQVDEAYSLMDTSAFFKYCNELSLRAKILDIRIYGLQVKADSLQAKNDSLNTLMGIRVFELNKSFNLLKTNATAQANTIDSLSLTNTKLIKKANKKFTIGIGAFGGLTNYGFGGGVGIVVSKTVFSF